MKEKRKISKRSAHKEICKRVCVCVEGMGEEEQARKEVGGREHLPHLVAQPWEKATRRTACGGAVSPFHLPLSYFLAFLFQYMHINQDRDPPLFFFFSSPQTLSCILFGLSLSLSPSHSPHPSSRFHLRVFKLLLCKLCFGLSRVVHNVTEKPKNFVTHATDT